MHKSILKNFDKEINKLLEGYNVLPRPRAIDGRQAPVPGPNVNFTGPTPTGFKGSGPAGIAPSSSSTVLVKWPKDKRRIKKKKRS